MERYVELTTDQIEYVSKNDIHEYPIPIYLRNLLVKPLDISAITEQQDAPCTDIDNIKTVFLPGYAWKQDDNIYVEFLNVAGYFETTCYSIYDYPLICRRYLNNYF